MKYVKHPIPEEITDKGGASVQLVQKQTIPLDGAIDAAIEAHYAIGQKEFIRNGVIGTMKSMAAGVRRDGRPRSIEGFLTVFPVFKGPIDLEKGFDPAVNKVQIKARLLNELELDISDWTFEDVTPGKRSFKLDSVKAGSVMDVYQIGEIGNINGSDLPSTAAGEELRVHWAVEGTDKSGDIPADKLSSDVGRADIAADALAELLDEAYDGKTLALTLRGNFSSAKIRATIKIPEPIAKSTDGHVKVFGLDGSRCDAITLTGVGLEGATSITAVRGKVNDSGSWPDDDETFDILQQPQDGKKLVVVPSNIESLPPGGDVKVRITLEYSGGTGEDIQLPDIEHSFVPER